MKKTKLIRLVLVTTALASFIKKDVVAQNASKTETQTVVPKTVIADDTTETYAPDYYNSSDTLQNLNYTVSCYYWPVYWQPELILRGGFGERHASVIS